MGTATAPISYKVHGLMVDVIPTSFSSTTDYYDVNVTVNTLEGLTLSIAKVQLEQGSTVIYYLGAVLPGDPVGLYRFNISAVQVGTEWGNAIQVVVGIDLSSVLGDYTFVGENFGGDMIPVSYDILGVTLDRGNVTALIDQTVELTVTENGVPLADAKVYATGAGYNNEDIGSTTDSSGKITFSFTGDIPETIVLRAEKGDLTMTGSATLEVLRPEFMLYNLTVNDHQSDYITAGLKAYIYNYTILDGDGNEILSEDHTITTGDEVGAYLNVTSYDLTATASAVKDDLLLATLGIGEVRIDEAANTVSDDPLPYSIEFSAADADTGEGVKDGNTLSVFNITVLPPLVSNSSSYTGFPVTYTVSVGQSTNFYIKIQDADGVLVEGAAVTIDLANGDPLGTTDSAGETTITWEPSATGTYDLSLNGVLDIGVITVVSYVAPQLVIDYTPETVYIDDTVIVSVTVDGDLTAGILVSIVDPDGITTDRTTTGAGTCTFTADKLGEWGIWAYYSEDNYEYISLEVLASVPVTEYDIDLIVGWNLISLPLIPEDPSITVILTEIIAYVDSVWAYDAVTESWPSYSPGVPSDLTEMVNGKGYWIDMSASAVLSVSGTEIFVDTPPQTSYTLTQHWNLLGMPYIPEDTSIDVVFSGILDHIESIWTYEAGTWYSYKPGAPSDLTEILAGKGYWIKMTTDGAT